MRLAVITLLFSTLLFFSGCGDSAPQSRDGRFPVACGLPPVASLIRAVGGERIDLICLLPEGRSPHDYSPRPGELRRASGAKLFCSTGMAFENSVAAPLKTHTEISDVTRGIRRRPFDTGHHHGEAEHEEHEHHHDADELDPHVWLSPANAEAIAANILADLTRLDPAHAEEYQHNFAALRQELWAIDAKMKTELAPYEGREFYVYHPAFGYFADAAKLKQRAIEINGREATAAQLAAVIREANEHQVKVIFVQPQFNPASAAELARRINGKVVPLDPLASDLLGTLKTMPQVLKDGFGAAK